MPAPTRRHRGASCGHRRVRRIISCGRGGSHGARRASRARTPGDQRGSEAGTLSPFGGGGARNSGGRRTFEGDGRPHGPRCPAASGGLCQADRGRPVPTGRGCPEIDGRAPPIHRAGPADPSVRRILRRRNGGAAGTPHGAPPDRRAHTTPGLATHRGLALAELRAGWTSATNLVITEHEPAAADWRATWPRIPDLVRIVKTRPITPERSSQGAELRAATLLVTHAPSRGP
jgi:hypothetical protein